MITDLRTEVVYYTWGGARFCATNIMFKRDGVQTSSRYQGVWTPQAALSYLESKK